MGLFDWFRRAASGTETDTEPMPAVEPEQAEVAGLNFMSAIDAHMKWKVRLEDYIRGTSGEALRVEAVASDRECTLGKWVYGEGDRRFGGVDQFREMREQHAEFHRCAGNVLTTAQTGDRDAALGMLQRGEYVRASERVKMSLAKLYVQIARR